MSKDTILVVDDLAENLDVVRGVLADDYKVKAAINGEIALKIVESQKPDLILLDIMMPVMDGYELCQRIKEQPATKDIPIIFLTGLSSAYEEAKGFELGAVDYISKPINPNILRARVKTQLDLSSAQQKLLSQKDKIKALYQELNAEINKAAEIHEKNFLAQTPDCEGLSLAVHFQPAQRLGGDFYSFIKLEDKLVFYLSDVTGHGLEGVVFNAFVKEAVASYIQLEDGEITPAGILEHVYQQYVRNNYPDDYFVCIFLVVLDLESKELSYSGVGFQNAPLVSLAEGGESLLESTGPPISSAIPAELMNFKTKKTKFKPGTTIFFSTDGIAEQMCQGANYEQRLEEFFYANSQQPPQKIVELINQDFQEFNNGSQYGDDDITYIILNFDF